MGMSALPLKADIPQRADRVRKVPEGGHPHKCRGLLVTDNSEFHGKWL
jgi:hypothetical protein